MIYGVGCDIIEISRIEKAASGQAFLMRCFTEKEIEYFKERNFKAESVAAGFAAKEAAAKAIKTGFSGFGFSDIEILHEENGCPYVALRGKAKEFCDNNNIEISISMSHCKEYAMATAVAQTKL